MKKKASFSELINGPQPVLVDFYADWCGPCRAMEPIIKEVAAEVGGQARVIKINIDNNRAIAMRYAIRGVPTFMLFKDGEVKWRQSGMQSAHALTQKIAEFKSTTHE